MVGNNQQSIILRTQTSHSQRMKTGATYLLFFSLQLLLFVNGAVIENNSTTNLIYNDILKRPTAKSLTFLGTVEGKSYFFDNIGSDGSYISWFDARDYCESVGLKLATITSVGQHTLLRTSYDSTGFHWRYWVAGRESRELDMFTWDALPGSRLIPNLGTPHANYLNLDYQICLAIATQANSVTFVIDECFLNVNYNILCET